VKMAKISSKICRRHENESETEENESLMQRKRKLAKTKKAKISAYRLAAAGIGNIGGAAAMAKYAAQRGGVAGMAKYGVIMKAMTQRKQCNHGG